MEEDYPLEVYRLLEMFPEYAISQIYDAYIEHNFDFNQTMEFIMNGCLNIENILSKESTEHYPVSVIENHQFKSPTTDLEAFDQLSFSFQDLLSSSELSQIWRQITRDHVGQTISFEEKLGLAKAQCEFYIECNFSDNSDFGLSHQKNVSTVKNSEKLDPNMSDIKDQNCLTFLNMFTGLHSKEKLLDIWNSIDPDEKLSPHDKIEFAIYLAMDNLEDEDNIIEFIDLVEDEYKDSKSEKQSNKKGKNNMTCQEAVTNMVLSMFSDSNITSYEIKNILALCKYDIDASIQTINEEILRKDNLIRPQTSFADVVSSESSGKIKKVLPNENEIREKFFNPKSAKSKQAKDQMVKKKNRQHEFYLQKMEKKLAFTKAQQSNFGHHFLSIAREKNPSLQLDLSGDLELIFLGIKDHVQFKYSSVDKSKNVETLIVDFHGLPVVQSLQLANSIIDFYQNEVNNKSNNFSIVCNFIVGKGLHSKGGIAKIKPAIEKLLLIRNLECIPSEGQIYFYIKNA